MTSYQFQTRLYVSALVEDLFPQEEREPWTQKLLQSDLNNQGVFERFSEITNQDVTSAELFPINANTKAQIISKSPGVLSGITFITGLFHFLDRRILIQATKKDGDLITQNDIVIRLHGPIRSLLIAERIALNMLSHLSGIASGASKFALFLQRQGITLLDTRKTTPGLRMLEKQSTVHGGASNHRMGLWDALLIKDTHVDFLGGMKNIVAKVKNPKMLPVIIEVRNLGEVKEALKLSPTRILFDNMSFKEINEALSIIPKNTQTEISGNIDPKDESVVFPPVNFISVGNALTLGSPPLDFSLQILDNTHS